MKKMVRGAIAILALSGLSGCIDDPLMPLNGDPNKVHANPTVMNVKVGDSSAVLLRLVNNLNNAMPTTFTISGVGAGIAVSYDTKYRPEYVNGSDTLIVPEVKSQQRYFVKGVTLGEYTFTATAGGISGTVKVRVEPVSLGPLAKTTANPGDALIITAPTGTTFATTATVAFTTGATSAPVRSADGRTLTMLLGPGVTGPATVTGVVMSYLPAAGNLTLTSSTSLTTPALSNAPTTVSSATPASGASVTVALGGSIRFLGTGKVFIGGVEAGILSLSADSSTATIVPAFNSTGAVTYTGVALSFLTTVPLALPSDGKTIAPTATFGGVTLPGGTDITNAPEIALPTVSGRSAVVTDQGGYGTYATCLATLGGDTCRLYKLVVPATTSYTLVGNWDTNADMGFYRLTAAGAFAATVADALGQSSSRTESGNMTSLAAGTYYIAVTYYGTSSYGGGAAAQPGTMQMRITKN